MSERKDGREEKKQKDALNRKEKRYRTEGEETKCREEKRRETKRRIEKRREKERDEEEN